ncbi:MAG: peroxiredoxin family protein [Planctomycetota bacterium]
MKPRFLVLLLVLSAVAAATAYRVSNPHRRQAISAALVDTRPAPGFQLLDQNNRPVQLRGYLGRHRVLVAFFDGRRGPLADPVMQRLKEYQPALKAEGVLILAISTPLAPDIKPQTLSFPFPVLRDTVAGTLESCSRAWGVCREAPGPGRPARISPALFLVDRSGLVAWSGDLPRPLSDPEAAITGLLRGE